MTVIEVVPMSSQDADRWLVKLQGEYDAVPPEDIKSEYELGMWHKNVAIIHQHTMIMTSRVEVGMKLPVHIERKQGSRGVYYTKLVIDGKL
jgi:hypothetical protein